MRISMYNVHIFGFFNIQKAQTCCCRWRWHYPLRHAKCYMSQTWRKKGGMHSCLGCGGVQVELNMKPAERARFSFSINQRNCNTYNPKAGGQNTEESMMDAYKPILAPVWSDELACPIIHVILVKLCLGKKQIFGHLSCQIPKQKSPGTDFSSLETFLMKLLVKSRFRQNQNYQTDSGIGIFPLL